MGSNKGMRAAMVNWKQLANIPYGPEIAKFPLAPLTLQAFLTTEARLRFWRRLLNQSQDPQITPRESLRAPPVGMQPMEAEATSTFVHEEPASHSRQGIPHMFPGNMLPTDDPPLVPPPGPLSYVVRRLRLHYRDGQQLSNAIRQFADTHADENSVQLIHYLLEPFDRFVTFRLGLLNSEHPE